MSPPSLVSAWVLAARPKTLAAGVVPVVVGTAIAMQMGAPAWGPALACLLASVLIQIGTNLANDYFDFRKGADTEDRLGPARAVQQGWLSPTAVATAAGGVLLAALGVGLYLIDVGGWPIAVVGISSLVCAVAYTGGPYPLAYLGLGDVFVFVFFGLAAVVGTVWVQTLSAPPISWLGGACIGCLATAILVVNNVRDRHTDAAANKRTLAVRFGATAARWEYTLLLVGAFGLLGLGIGLGWVRPMGAIALLSAPLAVKQTAAIWRKDGEALNPHLGGAARLELVFGLLFSIGLIL